MSKVTQKQIGSFPEYMRPTEARIVNRLITEILKRNLLVSIHDGEEWSLRRSSNRAEIQEKTATTDWTKYRCVTLQGEFVASFLLIHGNDEDVISDCSDNALTDEICKAVEGETA